MVFRGVQVGRVSTISLDQNQAQVTVLIEPSFKVPATSTATIEPVNLFGAEQVSITSPHGNADTAPYLAPGAPSHTPRAATSWATCSPPPPRLLNKIDTTNLSTVLGELAQASQGEGPKIAASISAGTQLAGLLDRTLNAQLLALDSFAKFTQAVAPAASDLNNLNAQINAGLPAFNAEEADYENLLNTLIPFSNRLAALLSTYHPDIATILESGDNVSRVLLAQQNTIGQVVNGAYHYFQKIAQGASGPEHVARREHVRLLQHLHPLQRREQPRVQPDRAADRGDVVPPADPAGPRGRRFRLQLLVRAGDSSTRCRPRPPRRRRRAAVRARPSPSPTAAAIAGRGCGGQPGLRHHRAAGPVPAHEPRQRSSRSSSGARHEAAPSFPGVGVQVRASSRWSASSSWSGWP